MRGPSRDDDSGGDCHGKWDRCACCGYTAQISRSPAYGGFLCRTKTAVGVLVVCWNGRECSLRLRRLRRQTAG